VVVVGSYAALCFCAPLALPSPDLSVSRWFGFLNNPPFPRWWCCFACLGLFKNSGHVLQVRPLVWGFKNSPLPSSAGGGGGGSASSLVLCCYSASTSRWILVAVVVSALTLVRRWLLVLHCLDY
jgi:hypothetical protein